MPVPPPSSSPPEASTVSSYNLSKGLRRNRLSMSVLSKFYRWVFDALTTAVDLGILGVMQFSKTGF